MYHEVDTDLPRHPKSLRLATALKEPRAWTRMVELWLWACQYALDGDLSMFTDDEIGQAMGYQIDAEIPSALKNILIRCGFLDKSFQLHGWEDRGKYLKKKRVAMRKLRSNRGTCVTPLLPICGPLLPMILERELERDLIPKDKYMAPDGASLSEGSPPTEDAHYPIGAWFGFEFWPAYPVHSLKAEAEKSIRKLNPDNALRERILKAISERKQWAESSARGAGFLPGWPEPHRWIKKRRWEDEAPLWFGAASAIEENQKYKDPEGVKRLLENIKRIQEGTL